MSTIKISNKLCLDNVNIFFLKEKRVLIRVDYNVPIKDGKVTNSFRIVSSIPTIRYCMDRGAKTIILMSHLGRPDGQVNKKYSLAPVAKVLESELKMKIVFLDDCVGQMVEDRCAQTRGIVLLENLRFHPEEEGQGIDKGSGKKFKPSKESIEQFRKSLTRLGDIYVNDAFGAAHRAHSSIVGIDLGVRVAGLLMKKELKYFAVALESPVKPFLAILGGAKVSDKIKLILNLLDKVDMMIIGGGMAFTFKKVIDQMKIGDSLFDANVSVDLIKQIVEKAKKNNVRLYLPVDFLIADKFDKTANTMVVTDMQGIPDGWRGLDCGPLTIQDNAKVIAQAHTIVWNGPPGVFEMEPFSHGTKSLIQSLVHATTTNQTTVIVGGGDSVAALTPNDHVSHISTGGGASLELLEGRQLPGITILSNNNSNININSKL
ncbi:phosphoglycerate kinase [Cavenderia fasciculata]|uniref:Phosphoglycerate kinase n=1 Tax=Cavenderia fasciculata TaxID=261658 RepID=F4Q5T2_CACFS|nr:phosphoglycerate kinase [Cavenderia fasciculata]EGG17341.1 phosphoglycerate kinase [Cavenderia fasciculata]|eukprot:XP_004355825.1 phosphoglycerate kinase [Cavenderia fasciculata]